MSEAGIADANAALMDAFSARDAVAAADAYTADGKLMAPFAEPFVGHAAIQQFLEEGFARGIARLGLETVTLELLGDTAWEEGRFTIWSAEEAEPDHGKYIVIWKKVGSRWLMARDIMSSNRPVTPRT